MHRRPAPLAALLLAFVLATSVLPFTAATSSGGQPLPDAPADIPCVPHPQIQITEEEGLNGFILGHDPATGQPIYRPGSGVLDGTGTSQDPYVIEGWCIPLEVPGVEEDLPSLTLQSVGIHITDTTAHVIIRDTVVTGQPAELLLLPEQEVGILVDGAGSIEIQDSTIVDHGDEGVHLVDVGDVRLTGNTVTNNTLNGVEIERAGDVIVEGNEIVDNGMNALEIDDAHDLTVTDNLLTDNVDRGLRLHGANHVTVHENTILRNNEGLDLGDASTVDVQTNTIEDSKFDGVRIDASQATLSNNTVTGNGGAGLGLDASQATVSNNTITDNEDDGVDLEFPDEASVENNTITSNGDAGVRIVDPGQVTLTHNNIHGNDDLADLIDNNDNGGVHADGGQPVDATHNWWGAADGPSGGIEDACLGTDADGEGELITVDNGGAVCFDPWLEGPVTTAGAP